MREGYFFGGSKEVRVEKGNFQERLREILADRDISEYRLAKDLNIPATTVSSWFVRKSKPREKLLRQIADYLGVSPAWLSLGDVSHYPSYNDDAKYLVKKLTKFGERYPNHMKRLVRVVDFVIKLTEEEEEEEAKKIPRKPKDKSNAVKR